MSALIIRRFIDGKYFRLGLHKNSIHSKFHTAHWNCVRSVLSNKNRSVNELKDDAGSGDFFGIESDVGVIHVKENSCGMKNVSDMNSSPNNKEHIVATSFGHLRFDSDNKLRFHGQFEENIEGNVPHGENTQVEKLRNISKKRGIRRLDQLYRMTASEKMAEEPRGMSNKVCPRSEVLLGNITTDSSKTSSKSDEALQGQNDDFGFVDMECFGNVGDRMSQNSNAFDERACVTQVENTSEDYCASGAANLKGNTELAEQRDVDKLHSFQQTSFIDDMYFGDLYNNESHDNSSDANSHVPSYVPGKQISSNENDGSASTSQSNADVGYIDSFYFGNHIEDCGVAKKHIPSQNREKNKAVPFVCGSTDHETRCTKSVMENIQNQGTISSSTESSQDRENLPFSPLKQRLLSQVVPKKMDTTLQKSRKEISSELDRNLIIVENKLADVDSSMNNLHDTQHSDEDKGGTAYNYALKLRGTGLTEKAAELELSHRIWKEKVLDPSKFTQTELLDLLKNSVLFSNDDVVVLNKPYNLVVHESETTKVPSLSSVLHELARNLDPSSVQPQLHTVHRLDKETTGCLILARNETAAQHLKSLFAKREIKKTYLVVTSRVPDPIKGVINIPIAEGKINNKVRMVLQPDVPREIKYKPHVKNGKEAITYYKVVSTAENAAVVEVQPITGIKHQIRVHFGFGLNCPVLGDHKYSHLTKLAPQRLSGDILRKLNIRQSKVRYVPMHIHAQTVAIPKFFNGVDLFVAAPLPHHFKFCLDTLKFKKLK